MALRRIFHIDVNSAFLSWSAADHLLMGGTTDYRTIHAAVLPKTGAALFWLKVKAQKNWESLLGSLFGWQKKNARISILCHLITDFTSKHRMR